MVGRTITSNDTKPELRWPVVAGWAADITLKRHQIVNAGITRLSKQRRRKYTKVHWTPGSPPVEENLDCGLQPAVLARHSRLLQSWPPLPSLGSVLCSQGLLIEPLSPEVPSQSAELGVQGGDRQEPRPILPPPGPIDLGLGSGCQLPTACLPLGLC